jgi:hypothetical protein
LIPEKVGARAHAQWPLKNYAGRFNRDKLPQYRALNYGTIAGE